MKKLTLLFFGLFVSFFSFAGDRTEQQMKDAAAKVLGSKTRRAASTSELKELKSLSKLKIFGYDEGGFAVVTTDDRFDEVIGYSASKCSEEMPDGFKWWMEAVNEVMEKVKGQVPKKLAYNAIKETGVGPLITTKWGQERPYNNQCILTVEGQEYRLLTGCVATAMAQVMNYYKYPTKGEGNNSYKINCIGEHTFSANFEVSYYDWDNMLDDYSGYFYSNTEDQHTDAVSKLMSDCGIAVQMNYNTTSSKAYPRDIPIALKNFFSYSFFDKTKEIYYRNSYSTNDWMDIIYTALNNNHPILYGGQGRKGGHRFIIHGYEPNGKVYINWGWNGNCDGYFMIDMLSPGTYTFNDNQNMIIPIPKDIIDNNKVYKLSYYVDGEIYKEYELKEGEVITPEPAPIKNGYTFSGWSSIPNTMPAKDMIVSGSFSKGTYKMYYMIDGEVYKTVMHDFGSTITPEPAPIKEGYTFSGWNTIPVTMPAKDVTVTGTFIINKYKLEYEIDGEVYKTYEIEYGAKIIPEAEPTKEGFTFMGWSIIPSTMPMHDVTIVGTFEYGIRTVNTKTAEIDGIYYILIGKSRTAEVTSSPNKYSGDVVIPESVEYEGFTYQVTQIGQGAFQYSYNLSSVSIPNSVTVIGNSAFSGCNKLSSIVLPNSIQDIGQYAFSYCTKLSSVAIPDGITVIRSSTFAGCSKLKSIKIPDTVTSFEGGVFSGCSELESISLPINLISIKQTCFRNCTSLSSIVIPEKVTNIYASTFDGCTNLKTVTIGKSVMYIDSKAFAECKNLESVICMAENPPTTNSDAFENSYIEYVTLYVPIGCKAAYKAADVWKDFKEIIEVKEEPVVEGDADGDGKVDVNDVTSTINHILNKPVATFIEKAADMDNDGKIDVNDVQAIIYKALGK